MQSSPPHDKLVQLSIWHIKRGKLGAAATTSTWIDSSSLSSLFWPPEPCRKTVVVWHCNKLPFSWKKISRHSSWRSTCSFCSLHISRIVNGLTDADPSATLWDTDSARCTSYMRGAHMCTLSWLPICFLYECCHIPCLCLQVKSPQIWK